MSDQEKKQILTFEHLINRFIKIAIHFPLNDNLIYCRSSKKISIKALKHSLKGCPCISTYTNVTNPPEGFINGANTNWIHKTEANGDIMERKNWEKVTIEKKITLNVNYLSVTVTNQKKCPLMRQDKIIKKNKINQIHVLVQDEHYKIFIIALTTTLNTN